MMAPPKGQPLYSISSWVPRPWQLGLGPVLGGAPAGGDRMGEARALLAGDPDLGSLRGRRDGIGFARGGNH